MHSPSNSGGFLPSPKRSPVHRSPLSKSSPDSSTLHRSVVEEDKFPPHSPSSAFLQSVNSLSHFPSPNDRVSTQQLDKFLATSDFATYTIDKGMRSPKPQYEKTSTRRFAPNFDPYVEERPSHFFVFPDRDEPEKKLIEGSKMPMPMLEWKKDVSFPEIEQKAKEEMKLSITAKDMLLPQEARLMTPAERRAELKHYKEMQIKYKDIQTQVGFEKKKKKLLQTAWRNGALSYDSPLHPNTIVYTSHREEMLKEAQRKEQRFRTRYTELEQKFKADLAFEADNTLARTTASPQALRPESCPCPGLSRRAAASTRFENTYEKLWPSDLPWTPNIPRMRFNKEQETRGRNFVISDAVRSNNVVVKGHVV
eukprot:GILI01006274.1.p1 GENE.GILI01006274.1~~GILI01006274.1.p1  ORF type:complete len:366 (+),score=68.19 GILI01006274.1:89-1186(+)